MYFITECQQFKQRQTRSCVTKGYIWVKVIVWLRVYKASYTVRLQLEEEEQKKLYIGGWVWKWLQYV